MAAKAGEVATALHVVLYQELERYSALLAQLHASCAELQRGIKGLVVMSADLDDVFDALYNAKVRRRRGKRSTARRTWRPVLSNIELIQETSSFVKGSWEASALFWEVCTLKQ